MCETVRTELGRRQRVVATLGKLTEQDLGAGWEDIEALLEGRKAAPRQLLLYKERGTANSSASAQWEIADLADFCVERVRDLTAFTWSWPFGDALVFMTCLANSRATQPYAKVSAGRRM